MRVLVLGGTRFLSHQVATHALAAGHEVMCAARGLNGPAPDGAAFVRWDREEPVPDAVVRFAPDAVVDVATTPAFVRRAVAALPEAHWVYVSTLNVYADETTVGATALGSRLVSPRQSGDPRADPAAYGGLKVACEWYVCEGVPRALILRPGLIVGPGDPSGRFTYWPAHAAWAVEDGAGLLIPGEPAGPVQCIDVRDLAQWIVAAIEAGTIGVYDAVGPAMTRAEFLDGVLAGVGQAFEPTWAPSSWLAEHGVTDWMGPGSIPLWVARDEDAAFMTRDVSASLAAGLVVRPLADTVRDTLAWWRATPEAVVTGLTRHEERALLDALG